MVTQSISEYSSGLSPICPASCHPLFDPRTAIQPIRSELRNLYNANRETLLSEKLLDGCLDLLLVIADRDNIRAHVPQYAQEIETSMTKDRLVNHSQGSDEFPSLIFRQDRHSSFPIQDGLIPGNHDNQLSSGAAPSLGGFQESDMAKVEEIECSSSENDFSASQPISFPCSREASFMDGRMILGFACLRPLSWHSSLFLLPSLLFLH